MKQFLLAAVLIALPVTVFTAIEVWGEMQSQTASAVVFSNPLGDLAEYEIIVSDTQSLAKSGDMAAAESRITDFETKWDNAESNLRPMAPDAWGNVDNAADQVFAALRTSNPDPRKVGALLARLTSVLAVPTGSAGTESGVKKIAGIAVSDANGHPLPCEMMLKDIRDALSSGSIAKDAKPMIVDQQNKAIERCNADDDERADVFAAQALFLVAQ